VVLCVIARRPRRRRPGSWTTAVQVARVLIPVAGFLNALRKLQSAPARPAGYVAPNRIERDPRRVE
jgi:hypothetical protein